MGVSGLARHVLLQLFGEFSPFLISLHLKRMLFIENNNIFRIAKYFIIFKEPCQITRGRAKNMIYMLYIKYYFTIFKSKISTNIPGSVWRSQCRSGGIFCFGKFYFWSRASIQSLSPFVRSHLLSFLSICKNLQSFPGPFIKAELFLLPD